MTTESYRSGLEQDGATGTAYLDIDMNSNDDIEVDLDGNSNDDVEVNIAIVGKAGSGRSSFVTAILGLEKHGKTAAKGEHAETESKSKEPTSYSHPKNPNINFSILPNMDSKTRNAFDSYLKSIEIERFDAFIIFTAKDFTKKHVKVAQRIKPSNKPFFLIRTKFDNDNHPEDFNKEAMLRELRASLDEHSKELDCREYEIHLISNPHPHKWDFLKLTKAIADALPTPQKVSFSKIPKIEELIAYSEFRSFIKEVKEGERKVTKTLPNMDEITRLFVGSGIVGVQRMMNQKLNRWKEVKIDLAILGESGVGKSSFINAIREVADSDEKAARTGVVETTRVPTRFEHPSNPNIRFWDLPGIGTPNYRELELFCEKVAFKMYDTFLIICAKRFTENDIQLARKVESLGKSFFFVRTKIDEDKRCEKRRLKATFNEEKMLKEIRDNCAENLKTFNFSEEKIFLVSSWDENKWDFERLKTAILDQLPSKQKESLALSMRTHSEEMLSEKIQILKDRVWIVVAASIASKITLGPFGYFVDGKLIRDTVKFYSKQLEFPNIDSNEFSVLSEDLQKRVKKFYPKPSQGFLKWLKSFDRNNTFSVMSMIRGKLIITTQPLLFVYRFLNLILDEMKETALAILCEAVVREGDKSSDSD